MTKLLLILVTITNIFSGLMHLAAKPGRCPFFLGKANNYLLVFFKGMLQPIFFIDVNMHTRVFILYIDHGSY